MPSLKPRTILFLSAVLPLLFLAGACAYTEDKSIQNVTIETPGAHDAVCYLYVEQLRYRVHPPEKINISKSDQELVVDCLAPGNRRRKIYIEPSVEDSFAAEAALGIVPAMAWDYASKAMFTYPDVIEISFVGIPVSPENLPAQNNPDIKQPDQYNLEEFSPGSPRLNIDRYTPPVQIRPRQKQSPFVDSGVSDSFSDPGQEAAPVKGDKSDLMKVIENLGAAIDPSGETDGSGSESNGEIGKPVPLYPGQ